MKQAKNTECTAKEALAQHSISVLRVSLAAGVTQPLASRALDPERFGSVGYASVILVRLAAEKLLRAHGWRGGSRELWADYDQTIAAKAA